MDKFSEFETFLEVTREGSFSRAADALGVTPSSVSKQIRALEDRLGARLLNRTTRRVSLTEAGRAFRERIEAVVQEVDEAEQAVAHLRAEPRGSPPPTRSSRSRSSSRIASSTSWCGSRRCPSRASSRADTQIHAVYPHRKHLSSKVRRFVDHLATHFGPRPYWDEGLPV